MNTNRAAFFGLRLFPCVFTSFAVTYRLGTLSQRRTIVGTIAQQVKSIHESIAVEKARIANNESEIAKLQETCGHRWKAQKCSVADGGIISIDYICIECDKSKHERNGALICIRCQLDMEHVPSSDAGAQVAIDHALMPYGKYSFFGASAFRCPKCKDLQVVTYWDK